MIKIITSHNIGRYAGMMDKLWRFRHAQFVVRLGWTELWSDNGQEKDRFDTDDAIHLIMTRKDEVIGYTRLLRTSGPHLLSDIYPEIMHGRDWPRDADIYEWTRCVSDPQAGTFADVQASHILITGVLEFCLVAGIKGMIVETHPKLVGWMRETGYDVETLQVPQMVNGVPILPVYIGATRPALERHHRMFGIDRSVLDIDDDLPNPVTGRGGLVRLPGLAADPGRGTAYAPDIDFDALRQS